MARGDQQRLCWLDGGETITGGTSFAAPHISAIVALIRQRFPGSGLTQVREILAANALESEESRSVTVSSDTIVERPDFPSYEWIGRAALYPYNAVAIVSEEGQQQMVDIVVNHFAAERGPVAEKIKKAG